MPRQVREHRVFVAVVQRKASAGWRKTARTHSPLLL